MICVIGSSYSRGAQGLDSNNPDTYIHNLLSAELKCEVINLSVSGHGSERYLETYIMACKKYKPKLIFAELWIDRTFCNLWLPTNAAKKHASMGAHDLYNNHFPIGINDGNLYDYKDLWDYKLFRFDNIDDRYTELFNQLPLLAHDPKHILDMYEDLCVYLEQEWVLEMRTIAHLMSVEDAADLVGIPVLWWTYTNRPIFDKFTKILPRERHLNTWHNINLGTREWVAKKVKNHMADICHITAEADKIIIKELMVPFIRNFL